MPKKSARKVAFWRFFNSNIIFKKPAENGALSIIDNSRTLMFCGNTFYRYLLDNTLNNRYLVYILLIIHCPIDLSGYLIYLTFLCDMY